jgi:Protein of unknown function (DUF2510)
MRKGANEELPDPGWLPDLDATPVTTNRQPGWYADPGTPDRLRYFDGTGWTAQVRGTQRRITSRPPGRRLAVVATATVALFGTAAVGAIWLQTPDLAHASVSGIVVRDDPAPQSTPIAAAPSDPSATPPAPAAGTLTCEDLFADVIHEARQEAPGRGTIDIVTVHGTTVVEDHYAELVAGTLQIPPGKTEAVVLACTATATATDGDDYPIEFVGVVDADRVWSVHVEDSLAP